MVAQMPLAPELKRGRKKEGNDHAGHIIDRSVGMKNIMFSLVAEGVPGVHHQAVSHRDARHCPPALYLTGRPQQRGAGQHDERREAKIQPSGNWICRRIH